MIKFFRNLFGVSIQSKVFKAIKAKIDNLEDELREEFYELKETYKENTAHARAVFKDSIQEEIDKLKRKKTQAVEKKVSSILSKLID